MSYKALLLATAATLAITGSAIAADPPMIIDEPIIDNTFDWNGFYLGINGGILSEASGTYPSIGIDFGWNWAESDILFGIEGDLDWYVTAGAFTGELQGRIGAVFDPAVLYIDGGIGGVSNGNVYGFLGAGVEFAVADNMSLGLQADLLSTGGGIAAVRGEATLNWHFD
jgi:outer membrane immunogenic protein